MYNKDAEISFVRVTGVTAGEDYYDGVDEQITTEQEAASPEQCSLITSSTHQEVTQQSGNGSHLVPGLRSPTQSEIFYCLLSHAT